MKDLSSPKRIDSASRKISASAQTIYQSFLNPASLISWLPPKGMSGTVEKFDARPGGTYKLTLTYRDMGQASYGKSSHDTDIIQGEYLELIPNERILQTVKFESADPSFSGEMIQTWRLEVVPEGTQVTVLCENVPEGIRKEDHEEGLRSTLENLAIFTE